MNERFRYRQNLSLIYILCLLLYSYISVTRESTLHSEMWWGVWWLFQSKLGHTNKKMVWLICISLTTSRKFNWSVSSFNDDSSMQQVCLANAAGVSVEHIGTMDDELSITVRHASHWALRLHSFAAFTDGPNSASCSHNSLLNLLPHHYCILTHPPKISGEVLTAPPWNGPSVKQPWARGAPFLR